MTDTIEGHGGDLALAALRAYGVREMFTLSGGHVFPLYDAAHRTGFLDLPLEVLFSPAETAPPAATPVPPTEPDPDDVARAASLLAGAERPVIIAGSDVYAGDAVAALREAAEALRVPVFTNGMGRGALPPGHRLTFAKSRRAALGGADVVVVVGTPLDFRLSFGDFGDARVVHIV